LLGIYYISKPLLFDANINKQGKEEEEQEEQVE
jgi:hypothetical protein